MRVDYRAADPDQASAGFQDLTIQTSKLASCSMSMFILSQFGRQLGGAINSSDLVSIAAELHRQVSRSGSSTGAIQNLRFELGQRKTLLHTTRIGTWDLSDIIEWTLCLNTHFPTPYSY